jgi:CBS domain-containing protein
MKQRPHARKRDRVLRAADLMTAEPITVHETMTVGQLCDLLQERNINGVPVVDRRGLLVGVVTQEDIIYGAMGHAKVEPETEPREGRRRSGRRVVQMLRERRLAAARPADPRPGERPFWSDPHKSPDPMEMPVSSIMTSPAISAEEGTPVADLCRIMWSLRIHRIPILKQGKVTGLVSSMDLCRAILDGKIKL